MNREMRRHPVHPFLPIFKSSKKRIVEKKGSKTSTVPKGCFFKKKRRD